MDKPEDCMDKKEIGLSIFATIRNFRLLLMRRMAIAGPIHCKWSGCRIRFVFSEITTPERILFTASEVIFQPRTKFFIR